MSEAISRRSFLGRSALIIAGMHAPLFWSGRAAAQVSASVHLERVCLRANNLDELAHYYAETLSLPVVESSAELLRVQVGTSLLEFSPDPDHARPFYHVAFTIPENQLDSAMAWLEPRSPITPLSPRGEKVMHFKSWNAHSCYFADPAGNILEFIAHHDLENGTSGDFEIGDVVRISEIGLVTPDVAVFEAQIKAGAGLRAYRDSSPVFSPIGDVGGLLITVREDRVWLGSDKVHAKIFPTEVSLTAPHAAGVVEPAGLPCIIRHESNG